jgi:hypothetical protein
MGAAGESNLTATVPDCAIYSEAAGRPQMSKAFTGIAIVR